MKSPKELMARMQREWQRKPFRLEMLTTVDRWPMRYAIGIPVARDVSESPNVIREHVARWKDISVGQVEWQDVNYRASSEPISMPAHWILERPSDWVRATGNRRIAADYALLELLIGHAEPQMRDVLINNLNLLHGRSTKELLTMIDLAARLEPGDAQGRPLRLLAGHGVDTKFFERNRHLMVKLLDSRFDGAASEKGLHDFLDAALDGEHWLLLVPLCSDLLPFEHQQVRSQELASLSPELLQVKRIIVIENRQCWHLLPRLENTLAILGSGLDLEWLKAEWLENKDIAYWGDIDTWGLTMLARARQHRPQLTALLLDKVTFNQHATDNAVAELVPADEEPPELLNEDERELYRWLLTLERGRLEQEYLPDTLVHEVVTEWSRR